MKKSKLQSKLNPVWQKIYIAFGVYFLFFIVLAIVNKWFTTDRELLLMIVFIVLIAFVINLVFFSQFILPVTNIKHRTKATSRLISYLMGNHGPAVFIEDGELRERKDERLKKGPGVMLLDHASAAVLRTPTKFLNAVGPGIAFTEAQHSIAGVVDLHIQAQRLGPRLEEDPFAPKGETETDAAYEARLKRKNETRAITRDGIEICANVSVVFKIDAKAGYGNSKFGYEPTSVERAIVGRSIDFDKPTDSPDRLTSWRWIPALIAVDIWREYISKITLNELFPLSKDETSQIDVILQMMRQRMVDDTHQVLDEYGRMQDRTEKSKETEMLRQRGIKIIAANITNIYLPKTVEKTLITRWKSNWLGFSKKEKKLINEKHAIEIQKGKDQALMDYAYASTHELGAISTGKRLSRYDVLKSLLNGNEYLIDQIPELLSELQNEKATIREIIEWVDSTKEKTS